MNVLVVVYESVQFRICTYEKVTVCFHMCPGTSGLWVFFSLLFKKYPNC